MTLSIADIKRLQAMEQAACSAPWTRFMTLPCVGVDTSDCTVIHTECSTGQIGPHTQANHEFIVAMRNAASELLTELLEYRRGEQ